MKLKEQVNDTLTIDNTHKLFKDTPYEQETFMVTFKFNNTTNYSALMDAYQDKSSVEASLSDNGMPVALLKKWNLLSHIIDWAGFEDKSGNELPCSSSNKSKFFESEDYKHFFDILAKIKDEHTNKLSEKNDITKAAVKKS